MKKNPSAFSRGIALVEVLVAAFVVGVGLMALSSLQGDFVSNSRENKVRAEAQNLANAKLEEFRDRIVKTCVGDECSGVETFDSIQSSASEGEGITGITESFKRRWIVTNETNPERKSVRVDVCWPANCQFTGNNIVVVRTDLAFVSLETSLKAANQLLSNKTGIGMGGGISLSGGSADDISKIKQLSAPATVGSVQTIDGETYIVQGPAGGQSKNALLAKSCSGLNDFENGLKTKRLDHDNETGKEAIELYESRTVGGTDYCIPRLRFNGGVIIRIRGSVHSGVTVDSGKKKTLLSVDIFDVGGAERGAYCFFNPSPDATSAPYTCYVGGNCKDFAGTPATSEADVTNCLGPYSAAKVLPGGWMGKIGLRGIAGGEKDPDNNTVNPYNVCFKDELLGPPETRDIARSYHAVRNDRDEGINRSYACQDFLIIENQANDKKFHEVCLAQAEAIGGFNRAYKLKERIIASGSNVYEPIEDVTDCSGAVGTPYTFYGGISGVPVLGDLSVPETEVLSIHVTDTLKTIPCSISLPLGSTNYVYNCSITTPASSVVVVGVYLGKQVSQALTLPPPTDDNGPDLTFTSVPIYLVEGSLSGSAEAISGLKLKISDGVSSLDCITYPDAESPSYACTIATDKKAGVSIEAAAASGCYVLTPTTFDLGTLSGSPGETANITGTTFSISAGTMYTVTGNIALGNNVDNLSSVAVSIENGNCTLTPPSGGWKKNKTGTYQCSACQGSNSMTFAILPTCSNTKTPFKYLMDSSGTTSLGTGQLVIDLGSLNSNQSKNLSLTESNTFCGSN